MFPRLVVATALCACAVTGAQCMEISREQCEMIRSELVVSATALKNADEALKDIQIALLDLVTLKFQLEQLGGDTLHLITDRLQKSIDTVSAANHRALAEKTMDAEGALAFMQVCGPPPQ